MKWELNETRGSSCFWAVEFFIIEAGYEIMRASLFKITTDDEGESKVIFRVPASDLADAIKLHLVAQKEIELTWKVVEGLKEDLTIAGSGKKAKTIR